ncbi:hypothetical protein [Oricola sp.]|uniref:hypothetical protein n=1 Tax=Oricola sp. TaxID=1979950 RepID=UPI003BAB76C4
MDVGQLFLLTPIGFLLLLLLTPGIWVIKRLVLGGAGSSFKRRSNALRIAGFFWVGATVLALLTIFEMTATAFSMIVGGWGGPLLAVLFFASVGARAYYSCTTPRMTGLWLRRFHVAPDSDFRISRVFERLSINHVRMMTLADSRVDTSKLSRRQAIYRLILELFMYIVFPASMSLLIALIWVNVVLFNSELFSRNDTIPDWFTSATLLYILAAILFAYTMIGVFSLVRNIRRIWIIGSGRVKLTGPRVFNYLDQEIANAARGAQSEFFSGMRILRIEDDEWQEVVTHAIRSVDLIFFDASDLSDQMIWELEQIRDGGALSKTVFLSEREQDIGAIARKLNLRSGAGLTHLVYGPIRDASGGKRTFRKALEDAATSTFEAANAL